MDFKNIPKDLDRDGRFQFVKSIVSSLFLARSAFMPTMIAIRGDNGRELWLPGQEVANPGPAKQKWMARARSMLDATNCKEYFMASEAWAVTRPPDADVSKLGQRVHLQPDKRELLFVMHVVREGDKDFVRQFNWNVERAEDGTATLTDGDDTGYDHEHLHPRGDFSLFLPSRDPAKRLSFQEKARVLWAMKQADATLRTWARQQGDPNFDPRKN